MADPTSDGVPGDPRAMRPDGMPVGVPFRSGDPRRGPGRRRNETACALARARRSQVVEVLVTLMEVNRTTTDPEVIREIRATAELLLKYSDWVPSERNAPTALDERRAAEPELEDTAPPAVDEEVAA